MIKIAIVGVGNLGKALLTYNFSIHDDMTITEAFDVKEDVIGQKIGNVIVKDNDELITTLKKEEIDVVILTKPERVAQKVADELVQAGVKGILNFTPGRINTPSDVQVHQIDLGIELQSLLFFMKNYSE
ncbi:Redox-sensitive transcriptional regulator (AT-rich DNA-binding protein) [Staphylococcus aureus]|nr:Redox-sensitive transcriptional regulator (AT-rich DNA-binding protein) [Staphylococcus aureus]